MIRQPWLQGWILIIAVDTAVAHLAGALGKPVWLLNRFDSCWRWLLNREDTPWYPSMLQFRQTRRGDWAEVIGRVKQERWKKLFHDSQSSWRPMMAGVGSRY